MNGYPLTSVWLRVLALVAVEIGLVALLFMATRRWMRTAGWRRALCQAALISCVVLAFSELSGTGRNLAALILRPQRNPWGMFPTGSGNPQEMFPNQLYLDPFFRSNVIARLARNQPQASDRNSETATFVSGTVGPQLPMSSKPPRINDSTVLLGFGLIIGIGAVFVAGRACLGRVVLIFLGCRRKKPVDSELSNRVQSLVRNLSISRRVRIVESRRLVSPIAFGFIRPTIGLPLNFAGRYTVAKQEVMLTHELAHLAAYDPLWYLFADLAAAMLWWHPGIWWLRRQLHLASELAADEASLITADGPRVLAECLVEMGGQLAKPAFGQLRVAGFRSDLGCRVQRLMGLEGTQWQPISRARAILARSVGPIAVSATIILCTAWAVPRQLTKGDSMKTMKQNWQRTLAAFATMAAIQTPAVLAAQENSLPPEAPVPAVGLAPATALPAAENLVGAGTPHAGNFAPAGVPGFGVANRGMPSGVVGAAQHYGKLEGKLREIVIDEVKFEGLPLSEVLSFLGEASRERDPEKKGINFLIDPNQPQVVASGVATIDPATGLPLPMSTEPIDVNSVSVRFNMPLRHVTMADVLDAIVRVADRPIQYSVEDYAVIFSLRPDANAAPPMTGRVSGPAPLSVRTFRVDTNNFVAGLESAFGIKVESKGKGESQSRKIQSALKELLAQLNVAVDGNKSIFYNELTGTVMVRASLEDLDVIQAAIETLGGQPMSDYAMRSSQIPPGTRPERYGIGR